MIDMLGKWTGYYIYGPEYGEVVGGTKVNYKLTILTLDNGSFKGVFIDEENDDPSSEDMISGFVEERFISFTKVYGSYFNMNEDGIKTPYDKLRRYDLNYYGNYDEDTKSFSGEWEIIEEVSGTDTPEGDEVSTSTGTWGMQRC